jgi:hypothetical protein
MNSSVFKAISAEADTLNVWRVESIPFHFAKVGTDAEGNDIVGQADLMDFIGPGCKNINGVLEIARNKEWNDPTRVAWLSTAHF